MKKQIRSPRGRAARAADIPEPWRELVQVAESLVRRHGRGRVASAFARSLGEGLKARDDARPAEVGGGLLAPLFAAV